MKRPQRLLQRDFTAVMQIPDDLHATLMKKGDNDFEDFGHIEISPKKDVRFTN